MASLSAESLVMMSPAELYERMTTRTLFASTENGFVTVPVAMQIVALLPIEGPSKEGRFFLMGSPSNGQRRSPSLPLARWSRWPAGLRPSRESAPRVSSGKQRVHAFVSAADLGAARVVQESRALAPGLITRRTISWKLCLPGDRRPPIAKTSEIRLRPSIVARLDTASVPHMLQVSLDDHHEPLVADFVRVGVGDHAVLEPDDAVRELADPVVVRDDDDGLI
jgi:hypothetical protein